MDITTVVMIAAIVFANIGTMLGCFMWATSHADNSMQNTRMEMQNNRMEMKEEIKSSQEEMRNFSKETQAILKAISDEMRDFHARLCVIEERNSNRLLK